MGFLIPMPKHSKKLNQIRAPGDPLKAPGGPQETPEGSRRPQETPEGNRRPQGSHQRGTGSSGVWNGHFAIRFQLQISEIWPWVVSRRKWAPEQDSYQQKMPSRSSGQGSPKERLQNKIVINRKCFPEPLARGPPKKGSRTRLDNHLRL